jgi:regulatory protein YycH of two-component signal transduction system YycFG
MAMKYEQIKSITLTLLVVSSVFLTWNLWTYQPNLEPIEESNITEDVIISSKKNMREILLPFRLLYHTDDKTYGTQRHYEIERMINQMSVWNITGLTEISNMLTDTEFKELVHGENRVEIIYPDIISFEVYRNIFKFNDSNLPTGSFDRIVVETNDETSDFGTVYFISYSKQQVFEGRIDYSELQTLKVDFVSKSLQHPEYFAYDVSETRTIYLPEYPLELNSYKYLTSPDSLNKFVDALFSEPALVSNEFTNIGEEYNDNTSLMRVNFNNKTFSFINIEEEAADEATVTNLISQTSTFINDHGGWPLNYSFQYFSLSKPQRLVHYRMFMHDLPVFNESGMSEYSVVLGNSNIYKYSRPYSSLGESIPKETRNVTLSSGREVLDVLLKSNINPELLEDITPGFKLANDVSSIVVLEPAWYYKHAGAWIRIQEDEVGGVPLGLE